MRKRKTLNEKLLLIIKGFAMGAINKVPGVSGGIIALVGGFYVELIYSLNKINFTKKFDYVSLMKGVNNQNSLKQIDTFKLELIKLLDMSIGYSIKRDNVVLNLHLLEQHSIFLLDVYIQ